tara:strand:- start:1711 stop:2361 length:651 start_codon:yes stop_codon:yes gene_type:complete
MIKITQAILSVMEEVKGIEKSMQVGTGTMQYKGVPDKEVKKIIGSSMQRNGLVMIPIKIEPTIRIDRWEQTDKWGTKQKQSVFTEVVATYKLIHKSGESIEVSGYGQGVDSQDKGAGKATTYALKYALLYTFLVPTGTIDDSDTIHSNDTITPSKIVKKVVTKKANLDKVRFENALKQIELGKYNGESMKTTFELTDIQIKTVNKLETKLTEDEKK